MMKIAIAILLLILFVFSSKSFAADPVLDIKGRELRSGTSYYIVSAVLGPFGGGLYLGKGRNQTCPLDVFPEEFDGNPGWPATFSPVDTTEDDVIRESTDLNIKFVPREEPVLCSEYSKVWKLNDYDKTRGKWFLTTGAVGGDPKAWSSRFQITRRSSMNGVFYYRLAFCPACDDPCPHLCGQIGRYYPPIPFGNVRFVLDRIGWPFMFIKAADGVDLKQVVDV